VRLGVLAGMVVGNTVRSKRHFALSAFGIVIGIGAFVFFLALSTKVERVLLSPEVFPIDRVEVVAPHTSILGKDLTKKLDDKVVDEIRQHPDVAEVVPRMAVNFPAAGRAFIKRNPEDKDPQQVDFEVGGFCDGIEAAYVAGETRSDLFRYHENDEKLPCNAAGKCGDENHYCDKRDNLCHHRVPVYVSRALIEIYNTQFASSRELPKIGDFETWLVGRGGLGKMRFYINFGETMIAGTKIPEDIVAKKRSVEAVLLGISNKAMPIGLTVPIEYVKEWNREFLDEEAARTYSSIVVVLKDKEKVGEFVAWVEAEPRKLTTKDQLGASFAAAIAIITRILLIIAFIIVTISSINIAHNFFMQVSDRRREIGVLRAVGATRSDIRRIILGEAALIGVIGGLLGIGLALLISLIFDDRAEKKWADFPFKPDSFFSFELWMIGAALGVSILFCVLGGLLPAWRASRIPPAQALTQQ
jgi:ABC-type lipoprotein release transport system permease subunit